MSLQKSEFGKMIAENYESSVVTDIFQKNYYTYKKIMIFSEI